MPSRDKKIAIVHDFLTKIGGAENLLEQILRIFPKADIFTLFYDQQGTKNRFSKQNIFTSYLQKNPKKAPKKYQLLLPKFPKAIEKFDFSEYDLVISHSNSFAHGIITGAKTLHLCYCLSPTRYFYDWKDQYLKENNYDRSLPGNIIKKMFSDLRLWDQASADRPDHYIAISKHVEKRIKKYYRLESEICYPAVDTAKIKPNLGEHEDFYLIVSRLSPYKKIDLAIECFNQTDKNLVIIGEGSDQMRLKSLAKKNIEFLGWQSEKSLFEYLRSARALIFPGEEDFGLTPIEAMASGTPVIAYAVGGVCETVIDGQTGLFFKTPTADDLKKTIKRFEDSFVPNRQKIRQQAELFSFENFKNRFIELVNKYDKKN
jgi:glycosyltransferase involved in cell wall biosynthesis